MVYIPKGYEHLFPAKKKNKYNAKKTVVDGHKFDSKKEAKRYQDLKFQAHCGVIFNLELQPKFVLQEPFKYRDKAIRAIKYIADFKYIDSDGAIVIEDVKGKKTDVYQIKKKMFLKQYPQFKFKETT